MELPQQQADLLAAVANAGALDLNEYLATSRADQSQTAAAATMLEQAGLVTVAETSFDEFRLGPDAAAYRDQPLPERVIVSILRHLGGSCVITEIPQHAPSVAKLDTAPKLDAGSVGQALRWIQQRGWAKKEGDRLVLSPAGAGPEFVNEQPDERLIAFLGGEADSTVAVGDGAEKTATAEELAAAGVDVAAAVGLLGKRKGFLIQKTRTRRQLKITDAGRKAISGGVKTRRRVTQLTPEMIQDGSWRGADFASYDVSLAAKRLYPGKEHPFQRTLDRVRRVFLEMGFTEIVSPWVESGFWDFDALYQPQDHPARDMQDTFYVSQPDRCNLPDDALVERIKATHETGGDTGSSGWQYRWNRELAHKPVLRTHTTAATIRALSKHAAGKPGKYFVIGPVFRRETVDFKHLPIFHQVDGIIVDPKASLAMLKGTLAAFYQKMGFPKVQFSPSFFPYTEPSAEVFAYLERRGEFVEMGGSGIFRPEVTRPLGIQDRVLAWGLGLERLAMLIHDLPAIGDIYFASMPWLREAPLSRA
ncbi:MAG: phenylalanine--tRNA ligase subunit alpha [Phycisphaerae bacterium]|nr:phenylalanine--tRNA ligase subunit alpha [Phycisphaerae bacterium]